MTDFILFGGKGGVGKTTCASSTALSLAMDGEKTLVVSTDPAHSISDVYNAEVESNPTEVRDNIPLYAQEVDPEKRLTENYDGLAESLMNEASKIGVDIDESAFDEMKGGIIGSDEAAVIDLFAQYDKSEDWDYVVFDTAPTGHTLKMIQLPKVLDAVAGNFLELKSKYDAVKSKVGSVLSRGDEEEEGIEEEDIKGTRNKLDRVSRVLRDGSRTQFYVVMEPEELSLRETEDLISEIDSHGISVGGIFINKVMKDINESCDFCSRIKKEQQRIIQETKEKTDKPLLQLELMTPPPTGGELDDIARNISVS